jgi:hypothetical protein
MKKDIIFTNAFDFPDMLKPEPASNFIPQWYKDTQSYMNGKKLPNNDGSTEATIKRCMPVFDAITAGYIIPLPADVVVTIQNGEQVFLWANFALVAFHPVEQAPLHPARNQFSYPKWANPWGIKTPKGYSTLFVQPFHRELPFTILPGIVDTDTYTPSVNFPFTINDPTWEGTIPAGTPIAQVIPFKRDVWKMHLGGREDARQDLLTTTKLQTKFFDRYKNMYWQRKEYK